MQNEKELNPAFIIGVFLSIFGVCVLIAVPVTPNTEGKVINLVCGLCILFISGIFIWLAKREAAKKS